MPSGWAAVRGRGHDHTDFVLNSKTSDSALGSEKKYTIVHRIISLDHIFQSLVSIALCSTTWQYIRHTLAFL